MLYGVVTLLSLVYVVAKVPETKGLSLSEVEAAIDGHNKQRSVPTAA